VRLSNSQAVSLIQRALIGLTLYSHLSILPTELKPPTAALPQTLHAFKGALQLLSNRSK